MILHKIVTRKKKDLAEAKKRVPLKEIQGRVGTSPPPMDMKSALTSSSKPIRIIAEVKKASPSKGVIREDFDPVVIAETYETYGASAISILTEENFFCGSLNYLKAIRNVTGIPLLCKDFIFDDYQVYQARTHGADAFLLIAAILDNDELARLLRLGRGMGMEAIVEVHDFKELRRVLHTGVEIIGINNRDLRTFKTDIETTIELLRGVPEDRIVVSESGINTCEDISKLKQSGADAFLIGESLMREANIAEKLSELLTPSGV